MPDTTEPECWYSVEYWSVPSQQWREAAIHSKDYDEKAVPYSASLEDARRRLTMFLRATPKRRLFRHMLIAGRIDTEIIETWTNPHYKPKDK